ncbi:hypothetical protein FEW53_002416 [Enterococcus faecalis]|nr:hypothetical protein [Enterococcus faecalis]
MPNSWRLINDFFEAPLTFIFVVVLGLGLFYICFYLETKLEERLRGNKVLNKKKLIKRLKLDSNISFFLSLLSLTLPEFPILKVIDVSPNILIFMVLVSFGIIFRYWGHWNIRTENSGRNPNNYLKKQNSCSGILCS